MAANYELKNIQDGVDDSTTRSPDVLVVGGRQTSSSPDTSIKPHHMVRGSQQQQHQHLHLDQPDDINTNIPSDVYKFVFIIFLIHGVGTLMPWNMFCTADAYFRDYKLLPTNETSPEVKSQLENIRTNFFTYLGIASQIPNLLFSGLNLLVDIGSGNLKIRVNIALTVELSIFILTIILASINSTAWPVAFFYVTMASVVLLNMVSGIYQNCIFGTAARFPPLYTNAVLIGSNLSGTYASIVSILSIYFAPENRIAAIYYFVTAVVAISICLISYNFLPYIKFFRFFDTRSDEQATTNVTNNNSHVEYMVVNNGTNNSQTDDVPEILRETINAMVPRPSNEKTFMERLNKKIEVLKKCKGQLFNVYLTFFVTLALFPTVLANVKPSQTLISNTYFGPVFCFLIFNSAALLGNVISYYTSWPGKDRVWILSVSRLLFIPFFLFCNFQPDFNAVRSWPVLIPYDIAYIIANLLMALTSGYLSSICMMFVSTGLKQDESLTAGMLGGFFLIFGIFSGVMSTFLLTKIVY